MRLLRDSDSEEMHSLSPVLGLLQTYSTACSDSETGSQL